MHWIAPLEVIADEHNGTALLETDTIDDIWIFNGHRARNSLRLSFPVAVFGSASTNAISRGYLYGAICALAWACSSTTSSSDASASPLSTTNAFTFCPRSGQGTPITAHSATAGCDSNAFSTSGAPML